MEKIEHIYEESLICQFCSEIGSHEYQIKSPTFVFMDKSTSLFQTHLKTFAGVENYFSAVCSKENEAHIQENDLQYFAY